MGDDRLLTTGELARLSKSTLRTVRFYEEAGLLRPVGRSDGGHRLFERTELDRLRLILDLREAGLSLSEIRDLFGLKSGCDRPEEASRRMTAILEERIEQLQHRIARLRGLRDELVRTLGRLRECGSCEDERFPHGCKDCEVVCHTDVPRAVRLLWS
ncbi:MAG: MerR family transcriptional regulator [Myxococcota bacterium]|nr:MerR family transcriptional regulator [Myxococcota bacterium]MDW8361188.1 MerR family transcriptional regulator [Myxococcales bacterium]